jgi:hypothetical protein
MYYRKLPFNWYVSYITKDPQPIPLQNIINRNYILYCNTIIHQPIPLFLDIPNLILSIDIEKIDICAYAYTIQ